MSAFGFAQVFLPLICGVVFGAIDIGRDSRDAVPVRAVTRLATADVNNSHTLGHEIFGSDPFAALIWRVLVIFRVLSAAAIENARACANDQDQQIPP